MAAAVARSMPVEAPRKRRKRAPPAGASNDCFTCAGRGHACDRRRPFCSQCLDDGRDCAGYKTQLTWGNGVASRGKLRGLSLPVAAVIKKEGATVQKSRHRPSASMTSIHTPAFTPVISIPSPASSRSNASLSGTARSLSPPSNAPPFSRAWDLHSHRQQSDQNVQHVLLSESPVSPMTFAFPVAHNIGSSAEPQAYHAFRQDSIHPVYPPPISDANDYSQQQSESSIYAQTPVYSLPPPLSIPLPSQTSQPYTTFTPFDATCNQLSPYASSFPQQDVTLIRSALDANQVFGFGQTDPPHLAQDTDYDRLSPSAFKDDEADVEDIQRPNIDQALAVQSGGPPYGLGIQVPLNFNSQFHDIGSTPRLKYLINYYAEVISPVIIAFDSPVNPFRTHILRLATESDALQSAIAALAASNLRQRLSTGMLSTGKTDPARRSSMAHLSLARTDLATSDEHLQAVHEETAFKNHAIALLNQHLSHPVLRLQDSTLAVLLILCLFHMCDTGVAKFSTQFQGVRKLLALRQKTGGPPETREGRFCTQMFAWWDGVTSSVNEREGLFGKNLLPPMPLSTRGTPCHDEEAASYSFEHLAGIDTELFHIMCRLGRLNMLAQGEDVEEGETIISRPQARHQHPDLFDGNGWLPLPYSSQHAQLPSSDNHSELFYREVSETQHLLSSWTPPSPISTDATGLSASQQSDLHHTSLTFYHAIHLYLARLSQPHLPSTHPSIQQHVHLTLTQSAKVQADVYLLWPLFVAGSECVNECDRVLVRRRIDEIQGDSGFVNNGVCGGVLEGIWRDMDAEAVELEAHATTGATAKQEEPFTGRAPSARRALSGFRWHDAMRNEIGTGEYIVV